ncbi:MAG: phosphoribosylformylglycinamidine cyclo-ligase [Thermoplasmata archaeon]|nr:phosphoribosylformylglycinamidine cyclo-ligase [Thermoplasmata archaeon]
MPGKGLTYSESGVDIEKEEKAVGSIVSSLVFKRTGIGAPYDLPGQFTGGVEFGDYVLSLCTDGVGSKILIADALRKWDTIGIDCMAMNVNDMLCIGAEPLAFVDYIAIEEPDPEKMEQIGRGLNKAAELANVSIIGGETATLPEIVNGLDLAGACLGVVKKDRIITGEKVRAGDAIIGLASSGLHSNGYTLARRAVEASGLGYTDPFPNLDRSIGKVMLEPTTIYVREIIPLLEEYDIHGMAHITGGGLKNIHRINPELGYEITDPLPVPMIFPFIQGLGGIEDYEMYRTFNMGMGFAIIAPEHEAEGITESLKTMAKIVGRVTEGKGVAFREMSF